MSMGVPYDKRIFPQKNVRGVENEDGATKNQKADPGQTQEVLVRVENEQQNLSNEEAKSKQADHSVDDDQAPSFLGTQVFLLSDLIDGTQQALQNCAPCGKVRLVRIFVAAIGFLRSGKRQAYCIIDNHK